MEPLGHASDGGGRCAGTTRDLLVRNALVHQTGDLEALTHSVELGRRTEVAKKGRRRFGLSQSSERRNQFVETRCGLGVGPCRNNLATRHISMLTCCYVSMQVIPALDLLGDDAVRLEQGDFDRVIFRQPIEEFLSRIIATNPPLVHIVDLQGARDGALRREVIERCAAVANGTALQVSGGIRSPGAALAAIDAGAQRVIVGTAAWTNAEAMADFVEQLADRLLVAFDVKDGRLAVRGWVSSTGLDVDQALERCLSSGVQRLHVTAVERDGTMRGPDLALYERVCASGLAVVAAGGVRDERDLIALEQVGCEAAVMGLGYLTRLGITL